MRTIAEIKKYLDKDYWENGKSTGKSGYQAFGVDLPWNRKLVECLNQVAPVNGRAVLDIGCGMGGVVAALVEAGAIPYGIDLSEYAVKKGTETCPMLRGRLHEGSAHDMKLFGDDFFDLIYSNQVFEHIPEDLIPAMMAELYRVMKPGAQAWIGLVIGNGRGPEDPDETHITIKPRDWWHERIEAAGLIVDYNLDTRFRLTKTADGYSFFDVFGWHGFSFRKP